MNPKFFTGAKTRFLGFLLSIGLLLLYSGNLAQACVTDADCNDDDPITCDSCMGFLGCFNISCDDQDPCTTDFCWFFTNTCTNTPIFPCCQDLDSDTYSPDGG